MSRVIPGHYRRFRFITTLLDDGMCVSFVTVASEDINDSLILELTGKDHRFGSIDNGHKKAASPPANICLGVSMLFV